MAAASPESAVGSHLTIFMRSLTLAVFLVLSPAAARKECSPGGGRELPAWKPSVPSVLLRRAVAHEGDMARFDRFIHKVVVQRLPVSAVVLGSSCAQVAAGKRGPDLKLMDYQGASQDDFSSKDGFLSTALDWLVKAYPPKELKHLNSSSVRAQLREKGTKPEPFWLFNLALGGTGPRPWTECLGKGTFAVLPKDIDLVLIEWVIPAEEDLPGALEAILRQVMGMFQPPPAVLFYNFFFWCRGNIYCHEYFWEPRTGTQAMRPGMFNFTWDNIGAFSFRPPVDGPMHIRGNYIVQEDRVRMLAEYYGVPMLSIRDAFFFLAAEQAPGYAPLDMFGQEDGGVHPSHDQAKTRYADIVTNFFRMAIKGYFRRHPISKESTELQKDSPDAAMQSKLDLDLPPPLYKRLEPEDRLWSSKTAIVACYEYEMSDTVNAPVREVQGFAMTEDPDAKRPKPGFATWKAGSFVEYTLDTVAVGRSYGFRSNEEEATAKATVEVRYLTSYERMGKATLECVQGCSCEGGVMEGHTKEHFSVPASERFLVSQHADCVIRILTHRSTGGEKFKILSLHVMFDLGKKT